MMKDRLPFIYIAALRRTGSTVLSEALTLLPYSFIFREPNFGKNRFSLKKSDAELFEKFGVDLIAVKKRCRKKQCSYVDVLFGDLMPLLSPHVRQVGVKEIRHQGWQHYLRLFPEMKVLLTARDPRDIYLSLYYRFLSGHGSWSGEYSPERVAEDLNGEFYRQLEMVDRVECLKVKYEELCESTEGLPPLFERIKKFVRSEIPETGEIGCFNALHPQRKEEFALHGNRFTKRRLKRWTAETNDKLVEEAHRTFILMNDYCAFWDYTL